MANPNTNLISSDALNVTKFGAWGAALAGVVSAIIAVIAKIQTSWPTGIVVALIGFAAVAFVVMGAVVIADMLVRRDLARQVVPIDGNDPSLPLLYQIWKELKPDLEKAAPAMEEIVQAALAKQNGHALEDVPARSSRRIEVTMAPPR